MANKLKVKRKQKKQNKVVVEIASAPIPTEATTTTTTTPATATPATATDVASILSSNKCVVIAAPIALACVLGYIKKGWNGVGEALDSVILTPSTIVSSAYMNGIAICGQLGC